MRVSLRPSGEGRLAVCLDAGAQRDAHTVLSGTPFLVAKRLTLSQTGNPVAKRRSRASNSQFLQ